MGFNNGESLSIQKNLLYTADTIELIAKKLRKATKNALGERELEDAIHTTIAELYAAVAMYVNEDELNKANIR